MSARRRLARCFPAIALTLSLSLAGSPSSASTQETSGSGLRPPSPILIEQAVDEGRLDKDTGLLYLAYALTAPEKLPAAYSSRTPFHGTTWLLKLRRGLRNMEKGETRTRIEEQMAEPEPTVEFCELSPPPATHVLETDHFRIAYNEEEVNGGPDGMTIEDYAESLEGAWAKEIVEYGWPAPPVLAADPPGTKYFVKITQLSPVLYGYVSNFGSHAGFVGDNPATAWDDQDAYASCMGLNDDYETFPGTPRAALDATTAHEFNHSIQFGWGALHGDNSPDSVFVEGLATWMEDEVYDEANDNYNYLWPNFRNDMGEYEDSPYPYWIAWRGLVERFGANVSGGSEQVYQTFWELTSKNAASNLIALARALKTRGVALGDAFHAYAIAVKFNNPCGGGYEYPYCFEEGPAYEEHRGGLTCDVEECPPNGEPEAHYTLTNPKVKGHVRDGYALNWIQIPVETGPFSAKLTNISEGGKIRGSLVCDTGSGFEITKFSRVVEAGESATVSSFDPSGCEQAVAVITNQAVRLPNPNWDPARKYTFAVSPLG